MLSSQIKKAKNLGKSNIRFSALMLNLTVSTLASMLAVLYVRWISEPILQFGHLVYVWMLCGFFASLIGFHLMGTNMIVLKHSTLRSLGKLVSATFIKEFLLFLVVLFKLFHYGDFVRTSYIVLISDLLITLVALVMTRILIIAIYNDLRNTPDKFVGRMPVMIFGTSDKSVAMVIRLENSPHYAVQGFLTRDKSKDGLVAQNTKTYCFENESDLERLKIDVGFNCILFAREEDATQESGVDGVVLMSFRHGIHCLTAPKIDHVDPGIYNKKITNAVTSDSVDFIPDGMSSFERNVKRIIDFFLSSVLIVVFSPLFLICYIALKLDDGGPAIFIQERIGRFGRPFNIYKFRSMRVDAESNGPALYSGDDDPRLTRVGGFLRRHHLDELPQLLNVWKGDMAFIGPRPERKFYIDQIMEHDPRYYFLYQIRPGVTSYSTLRSGYTDTMEKMLRRLEFDLYYLRHRSWWFDIKILWQTFVNIVFGKVF